MKFINTLILTLFLSTASAATMTGIDNRTWEQAYNSGDSEALAQLYTDDAVVIPPSLEILTAPDKIRQYWARQFKSGTDNFRVQTINVRQDGDLIYQTAVWIATVTSNGVATDLDGEMTNVMARQQDGSWKIRLQSWN